MSDDGNAAVDRMADIYRFATIVDAEELHGLAFQHLALCRRRAWFHLIRIDYAHLDERMAKGQALHDISQPRDQSVTGLMGLSPDRVDWRRRIVYEGKGGAGAVAAVSYQTAFYALMLAAADRQAWSAATNILSTRRLRPVPIDAAMVKDMLSAAEALRELQSRAHTSLPFLFLSISLRTCLMETLYITKDAKLTRQDATLIVRQEGAPTRRFPVNTLRHVVIAGEAGITTSVLGLLGRSDVRVTILDWHGNVTGTFEPFGAPSAGAIRKAQARCGWDDAERLKLAKELVLGAMANIRANLRYRAYRGLTALDPVIARMEELEQSAKDAASVEAVMGAEGNVRASYYEAWPLIDERLRFAPRRRRPPNNPLNCLISWFNGLLYSAVRHEIAKTHLDDCLSFLHASTEARHSLALDLSEPFKPVIVDTLIFEIVLRDRLVPEWFHQEEAVCRLSETGRRATLESWVAKLDGTQEDRPSMRSLIRSEAFAIERHVLGIAPYRAFRRKI